MATTTNYSWTTPDDTALVKDGAAAIRTLGSSIDTTTKNLNPSTTLGDIEYRSSTANTNTRLAIGSTGNVLTISGGVPVWAAPVSGGMTLISTTTLSGVTTTLSSIPQTYNSLFLIITGVTANTSDNAIRIAPNSVTDLVNYVRLDGTGAGTVNNQTLPVSVNRATLRTDANNAYSVMIDNYTSSTAYKPFRTYGFHVDTNSVNTPIAGLGAFRSNTAITSLVFDYGGANTFAGGTVLLYGVK